MDGKILLLLQSGVNVNIQMTWMVGVYNLIALFEQEMTHFGKYGAILLVIMQRRLNRDEPGIGIRYS